AWDMRATLQSELLDGAEALQRRFRDGQPVPHLVLDEFLQPELARQLVEEFAQAGRDVRSSGEAFRQVDDTLRAPDLLQVLAQIAGVPRLIYDPDYHDAGLIEHFAGAADEPRIENNYHANRNWYRCLNLVIYLNPDWAEEQGGALELHADPRLAERRVT